MNKCFKILLVYLLFITCAYTDEKTDKELEIGVYPAELKLLGNFKEINDAPNGLFPQTADEFHEKANSILADNGYYITCARTIENRVSKITIMPRCKSS